MTYWEKRQTAKYESGERIILDYYKNLEKAFEQARREVRDVIDAFYGRYAKENGLSYTDALKRLSEAEIGDLKSFIDRINETMGTYDLELTNMSIKARVSRYEALEKQIDAILQKLYAVDYEKLGTETLGKAYEDSYYHTWWNIDTQNGIHNAFSSVNPDSIDQLIKYPFNGSNFSSRLWKQKDYLQGQLMESITTMLIQGKHPKTLAKDFAKKFGSREYDAYRLLHTEYSYISEEASQAVYEEDGIEEYEYMATLDNRTCGICGDLDGRKIKIKAGVTGQNKPPMHPLCRCTTAPWIGGISSGGKRIARDENGNNIYVPEDVTYKEWKTKYIDENLETSSKSDIIKHDKQVEGKDVHYVGKIDKKIYSCITENIVTDEVIITDTQIRHIKDRHPNDFERFSTYFTEIVGAPDYIIEANKPDSALILKEISIANEKFKTILRLATSKDNKMYKNSIITFMRIDEKEWNRLLRNKRLLYKKNA